MPSNAKLARQAEEKAKKTSNHFYDLQLAPKAIAFAHENFCRPDAYELLSKFEKKAKEYFTAEIKAGQTSVGRIYFHASAEGMVLYSAEPEELPLFGVMLDEVTFCVEDQRRRIFEVMEKRNKKENENCFCYNRVRQQAVHLTNERLTLSMVSLRKKQKEEGTLICKKENKQAFSVKGRTLYTAVIDYTNSLGPDPLAFGVERKMIGRVYWFYHEANRDAFYNYIVGVK